MSSGGLFAALIDDAAVFPPGSAPLPDAVDSHRRLRQSPACTSVGPLLVPATAVPALLELIGDPAEPLTVSLVAAPGDVAGLLTAVDRATARTGLTVDGVEIAAAGGPVRELVTDLEPLLQRGIGVAIEIDRGHPEQLTTIAQLRSAAQFPATSAGLRGKFRTGGVQPGAVPAVEELAAVIVAAARDALPIKLTASLHHAVRTREQHGVLNVLLATGRAVADLPSDTDMDTATDGVAAALAVDDPAELVGALRDWPAERIAQVRAVFTSFGCCGVLEPLSEAAGLGLIPPVAHDLVAPPECR